MRCVKLALDTRQRFDPAASRHAFLIDATDYAITVLAEPLLRRVAAAALGIRIDFDAIPDDMHESEHGLRTVDFALPPAFHVTLTSRPRGGEIAKPYGSHPRAPAPGRR